MAYRPNYKVQLEQTRLNLLAAGLVSERYPAVSSIVFQMTYYYQNIANPVLMKRTLSYWPSNPACFHLDCMRPECTDGGFDLEPVVAGMVKGHKKSIKGKIFCHGNNEALRLGHASISYEVNIEYRTKIKRTFSDPVKA